MEAEFDQRSRGPTSVDNDESQSFLAATEEGGAESHSGSLAYSSRREYGDAIVRESIPFSNTYQNRPANSANDRRIAFEELEDDAAPRRKIGAFAKCVAVASLLVLSAIHVSRTETFGAATMARVEGSLSGVTATAASVVGPGLVPLYVADRRPPLSMTYPSDPLPFSSFTPADLGLDYARSHTAESRPGEVFGAWRRRGSSSALGASSVVAASSHREERTDKHKVAMPTNMWYENLLLGSVSDGRVAPENRAYTIPYIVDFVGPIPGIRVQFPHPIASDTIVQMATVPRHGLTLGAVEDGKVDAAYVVDEETPPSQLGLSLRWSERGCSDSRDCATMRTKVLRGIPYVTMRYSAGMSPAISAEVPLAGSPVIDDGDAPTAMRCGILNKHSAADGTTAGAGPDVVRVERDVSLTFKESDFTWLIFFSRPVRVACFREEPDKNAPPLPPGVVDFTVRSAFELRVVDEPSSPLIVRAALANNCTSGLNPLYCAGGEPRTQTRLGDLLRTHADAYPGDPAIRYEFPQASPRGTGPTYALIHFDWRPRSMREDAGAPAASDANERNPHASRNNRESYKEVLAYALPHHTDSMERIIGSTNSETGYCSDSLHGRACLLRGGEWVMREDLEGPPSFMAIRPPNHRVVSSLAEAISSDIHFRLPDYYMAGAGDTYFSGKMLAKLGRIIVIASELKGLAATPGGDSFDLDDLSERELKRIVEEARRADLPSEDTMAAAVARLRSGVEVWLNGTAEAKFLYDDDWGGLVNCGCLFNMENQRCDNVYPNCPAFSNPGLNFGNGFYNDHHFHYGYMIYAAAVVANYDLSWGRKHFQEVLALVRDIANPSIHDRYFPAFRHKDWFLGSSWASGIATLGGQPYLNGRNQESSSEAIHAYEAIGLYGAVMVHAWGDGISSDVSENDNAKTASRVRDMGRLLTATEIRSAQRYWHVLHGDSAVNTVYPKVYKPAVVGMMWDTMCQFQTWFGNAAYLAYGIQLMPLTSVSERRDTVKWAQQMYPPFAHSCEADKNCEEQGWSISQYAMLAVVGHRDLAVEKAIALPASVFESAGGNGHSLTNTLWYIATRPDVAEPLLLGDSASVPQAGEEEHRNGHLQPKSLVCECPDTCTEYQQDVDAGGYTCGSRIRYLMTTFGKTEVAACRQVGGSELPDICGGCDPDRCAPPPPPAPASPTQTESERLCPPCPSAVCKSEANRCPRSLQAPFLCLSGANKGGCAQTPWIGTPGDYGFCTKCCRLTERCFGV